MRALVVHNRYSSRVPSGENLAVDDEVRWLRDTGVHVETHEVSNDDALEVGLPGRVRHAAGAVWSVPEMRRMADVLDTTRADLVHIHNVFPLLSASVPAAAVRRGLPVVWTVHNFRLGCVIGTHFRDGQACHQCRPGWRLPGIRHACYGGSPGASAVTTAGTSVFRRLARQRVTAVAISEPVRSWLTGTMRFPADRVHVKHNGVEPAPGPDAAPHPATRRSFLFAGYLTDYKGVPHLLDAWDRAGDIDADLRFVGDGPAADKVRAAAATDPRITLTPRVPPSEVAAHLDDARAVVVPSLWEEPFGRTAAEALARGRPVITTGLGGLGDIVDGSCGWVTGRSADALADALREAATSDDAISRRSTAGRRRHRDLFSPRATTDALIDIYREALGKEGAT